MPTSDTHSALIEALRPKLVPCRIREFHPGDLEVCLDIYRSNEPDLLDPEARHLFVEFLAHGTSYMLVVEHERKIIACASLELVGDAAAARLLHAMVHRDFQHRGFGTTLLAVRLSLLEPEDEQPIQVFLRASPAAAAFYGAFGFVLHSLEKGRDTAVLRLAVTPKEIESIRAALTERGVAIELNEIEDAPSDEGIEEP